MAGFTEPILHVDMDAFYVEVERLRRPELVGRPVLVGGLGPRSVVAAASYEARAYGARSAMPMARARRLCPRTTTILPPDHAEYSRVSALVFEVLRRYTPLVEALSIDEAFLDVSGLRLHYGTAREVGADIRHALRTELGLPASVGVAATKFIAKLASEAAKPDGLMVVSAGHEAQFLDPLPVRSMWGVGEATHAALEGLGVVTIGDLAALPKPTLTRRLGIAVGSHLHDLAHGRDPRSVEPGGEPKSISVEETYPHDLTSPQVIDDELFAHCERLARRLRSTGYRARTLTLKVRYGDFTTVTRATTITASTDDAQEMIMLTRALADKVDMSRPVRLLGVGASHLERAGAPRQFVLGGERARAVTEAADAIRDRYGDRAVVPARLVDGPGSGKRAAPGADAGENSP